MTHNTHMQIAFIALILIATIFCTGLFLVITPLNQIGCSDSLLHQSCPTYVCDYVSKGDQSYYLIANGTALTDCIISYGYKQPSNGTLCYNNYDPTGHLVNESVLCPWRTYCYNLVDYQNCIFTNQKIGLILLAVATVLLIITFAIACYHLHSQDERVPEEKYPLFVLIQKDDPAIQ
jgi:hypothetical protein